MGWMTTWWIWGLAAIGFALVEVILPIYLFLGFAIGAGLTSILLLLGFAPGLAEAPELLLLLFAVLSLASWLGLRRALGVRRGQVKIIDRDINDD